jgi:hypothetical protein
MAAHVTASSMHDFKLFLYFFALFLIFSDIDACDFFLKWSGSPFQDFEA